MLDLQPILDKIQVQLQQAIKQRMEMEALIQQLTGKRELMHELIELVQEEDKKKKE
tara:strand:- start:51870 stop:52037 length:168 start_codon:yes stop_codon:yes gene_type:complete